MPAGAAPKRRDHALDAARAILMMMGVVLHAGSAYSQHTEWVVRDPQGIVVFDWLVESIHVFRMPAFFWISGYFFALTLTRGVPVAVLRKRFFRLVVPLAATWLTFNVAQEWIVAVADGINPIARIRQDGIPLYHLWFLFDLVIMSAVGALALWLPQARLARLTQRVPRLASVPALLLGLTLVSALTFMAARVSGMAYLTIAHATSLGRIATYIPYFAVGAAMYHLPDLRHTFLRIPPLLAVVALPLGMWAQGYRRVQGVVAEIAAPLENLAIWVCIAVVLQLFYLVVRRESRIIRALSDSSYSIYLFHHLIMIAVVLLLLPYAVGAVPKFLVACAVTFAVSAGMHVVLVRRSTVLRLLYNGIPARATPSTAASRAPG